MAQDLLPRPAPIDTGDLGSPQEVVEAFLAALADGDKATAYALVDDDIEYVNVGMPTVRGRAEMAKVLDLLDNPRGGFEVYLHSIATSGPSVLTERTDVLLLGKLRLQFWVWGRFDVHEGRITLWRDSFDYVDILRGTVRGLLGLWKPELAPAPPSSVDAPPGR